MLPFDFHCPTRIVYGPGRMAELGELTASLGGQRALVVSDPGIREVGHAERGLQALHAAGLDTLLFDQVQENPTTDNVEAGRQVAADYRPDVIVAVGGGSSMDCAKGINFVHSCGGTMHDYWGVGKAACDMLPMVAVPTTSGTGSEAQSFALISDAQTHVKMACGDKRAAFRIALLDPQLTMTQPPAVTALTGIDAVSHAVETLVTKKRNLVSATFSHEACRLLATGLPGVLANPANADARAAMQLGACFAGLAIENSMLGAAHALANPLTASYGIVHGQAVGVMLPHVVRHNAQQPEAAAGYLYLWQHCGGTSHFTTQQAARALADYLTELVSQAGLQTKLSLLGVQAEQLPHLAEQAAKQWTGTFNPVEMGVNDYLGLYRAAF